MSDFATHVDIWSDFFMLSGTAAATLIGLLFVAISLRTDIRSQREDSYLRTTASHSFQNYLSVLLISLYFQIPDSTPASIAWPIILTALFPAISLARAARRHRTAFRIHGRAFTWQFAIPICCYLGAMTVGEGLLWQEEDGIDWLIPVIACLLMIPTRNAWHMLVASTED
jgi:hypothetical protein